MGIDFNALENAIYHIRVNYMCCQDMTGWQIQFSPRGNGDVEIDLWDDKLNRVGNFFLSELTEEIAMLANGKMDFCDLDANNLD